MKHQIEGENKASLYEKIYYIIVISNSTVILFSKKIENFLPKIIFKQQKVVKESREYV
jgi:hypothetical protein